MLDGLRKAGRDDRGRALGTTEDELVAGRSRSVFLMVLSSFCVSAFLVLLYICDHAAVMIGALVMMGVWSRRMTGAEICGDGMIER